MLTRPAVRSISVSRLTSIIHRARSLHTLSGSLALIILSTGLAAASPDVAPGHHSHQVQARDRFSVQATIQLYGLRALPLNLYSGCLKPQVQRPKLVLCLCPAELDLRGVTWTVSA